MMQRPCHDYARGGEDGSKRVTFARTIRLAIGSMALAGSALTALPAVAQDDSEARIKKLEAEVRALQRKVFPGGDGKYFEPEITATEAGAPAATPPTTTAVTDMQARLDAMESQLQRLTAQIEEDGNTVRGLDARVTVLENGGAGAGAVGVPTAKPTTASAPVPTPAPPPVTAPKPEPKPVSVASVPAKPVVAEAKPAGPSEERLIGVQAILKPQTEDAGDDEYSYGFRLWDAGYYPEAQQQLALFLEKYPSHSRVSYARNLLGRAYLDDGKPRDAAAWFLKNYQTDKQGARAGDSLLYLAESMIALKDSNRACIALAEFGETYPALATGRLKDQYEADRQKVTCN